MAASTTVWFIALSVLAGNDPAGLNALQQILEPYTHQLTLLWMAIWLTTAIWVLIYLLREGERDT